MADVSSVLPRSQDIRDTPATVSVLMSSFGATFYELTSPPRCFALNFGALAGHQSFICLVIVKYNWSLKLRILISWYFALLHSFLIQKYSLGKLKDLRPPASRPSIVIIHVCGCVCSMTHDAFTDSTPQRAWFTMVTQKKTYCNQKFFPVNT